MTMQRQRESDPFHGDLFLPGEHVRAGIYRRVGSRREICLEEDGYLPASLDGHVACYTCVSFVWEQHQSCVIREPGTSSTKEDLKKESYDHADPKVHDD